MTMLLCAMSCVQSGDFELQEPTRRTPFELLSTTTRTSNDGLYTLWSEGDNLCVFHAQSNTSSLVRDGKFELINTESGLFKGSLADKLTEAHYDWYAIYPYSSELTDAGYANTIGSKYNSPQVQIGNNNSAHLCGEYLPLVGVARCIPATDTPAITMAQVASFAKFTITNRLSEPISITDIRITAEGYHLVGDFYIDFAGYESVCTAKQGNTSSTAHLKVVNGEVVAAGASATFYIAVAPFTATAGSTISFSVSAINDEGKPLECTKKFTPAKEWGFTAGKYKEIGFGFEAQSSAGSNELATTDISNIVIGWNYNDSDIKSVAAADGGLWSAYHAYRATNSKTIAVKADAPDGYLATPVVSGRITKIVMNLKSTGTSTKFTLSNGTDVAPFYTSEAMGRTTQDWEVEISEECHQIAIRAAAGVVTINSVTIYYE